MDSLPSYAPARMAWPEIVTGDTFPDMPFGMTDADGAALSPSLARVLLIVKTDAADADTAAVLTRDSNAGHISITDAAAWQFQINEFTVALAAADYAYKLVTIDTAGDRRTWLAGSWHIDAR
jgi:hypothetical protein